MQGQPKTESANERAAHVLYPNKGALQNALGVEPTREGDYWIARGRLAGRHVRFEAPVGDDDE